MYSDCKSNSKGDSDKCGNNSLTRVPSVSLARVSTIFQMPSSDVQYCLTQRRKGSFRRHCTHTQRYAQTDTRTQRHQHTHAITLKRLFIFLYSFIGKRTRPMSDNTLPSRFSGECREWVSDFHYNLPNELWNAKKNVNIAHVKILWQHITIMI